MKSHFSLVRCVCLGLAAAALLAPLTERVHAAQADAPPAGYREIAKRVDAELPKLFAELPRAPYGTQAMPAHQGANRAEYYNGPAADGSRAGFFFAETLGFDLGLYTDPYSRYGHLQWQAFRAARLVADTGLHALGWSSQQAINFMVERTGVEREFVTGEVDRYVSQPGQALAYMIGKLKFDELRDRAKARLGARFDIRTFHNAVLDNGALPLATLDGLVDEWISAQSRP